MKHGLHLITLLVVAGVTAQTYHPDNYGHVSDPKFQQLIQTRGYTLVGAYETVGTDENGPVLAAEVLKAGAWMFIDVNGKEYPDRDALESRLYRHGETEVMISVDQEERDPYDGPYLTEEQQAAYWKEMALYNAFTVGTKTGFLHGSDTILPAAFDRIEFFDSFDRLLIVQQGEHCGAYDCHGKLLVPVMYDKVFPVEEGGTPTLAFYAWKDQRMAILSRDGNVTIPFVYPRLDWIADRHYIQYSTDPVATRRPHVGIMDSSGCTITPAIYEDVYRMRNANCWIVACKAAREDRYGAIDLLGNLVLDTIYRSIRPFSGTLCKVALKGESRYEQAGLYDVSTLQFVLPCKYVIESGSEGRYTRIRKEGDGITWYGLIDNNGKLIVQPVYTSLTYLQEDSILVLEKDKRFGITDLNGKVIVPFRYQQLEPLKEETQYGETQPKGYFIFAYDGKYGLIDLRQDTIIPPVYSSLKTTYSGILYRKGKAGGLISVSQQQLLPEQPNELTEMSAGIFLLQSYDRQRLYLDLYGNKAIDPPRQ